MKPVWNRSKTGLVDEWKAWNADSKTISGKKIIILNLTQKSFNLSPGHLAIFEQLLFQF
jgi:hypothetical protein